MLLLCNLVKIHLTISVTNGSIPLVFKQSVIGGDAS